jgi:hypothetical protein
MKFHLKAVWGYIYIYISLGSNHNHQPNKLVGTIAGLPRGVFTLDFAPSGIPLE